VTRRQAHLAASGLVLHVVRGADLGPDVLQVRHGGRRQGGRRAALERAGGFGRGADHRDLLDLVGLGRRLGGRRLARGGLWAAVATPIWRRSQRF